MDRTYLVIDDKDTNKVQDLLEDNNIKYYGSNHLNYLIAYEKAQEIIDVNILQSSPNDIGSEHNKKCLEAEDLKDYIMYNINSDFSSFYFENIYDDWNINRRSKFWRDKYR